MNGNNKTKRISVDCLLEDKRFIIDKSYFSWGLKGRFISEYKIEKIKLSDIKRDYWGKVYPLDTLPFYKYLKGDKSIYKKYYFENLKKYKENRGEVYVHDENIDCYKNVDSLIESLQKNGYNNEIIVIVDFKNRILDRDHRSC